MINWKKVLGAIAIIIIIFAGIVIEKAMLDRSESKNVQKPVKTEIEKAITAKGLDVEFIFRENPKTENEEMNNKSTLLLYYSADKFVDSVQPKAKIYMSLAASGYPPGVEKTYWTFIPDHAGFIVYKIIYEQNQEISAPDGYYIIHVTFNQDTISYGYSEEQAPLSAVFAMFFVLVIGGLAIIAIYEKFLKS